MHITPHLGGGVGSVLSSFFKKSKELSSFKHEIVTLDSVAESSLLFFSDIRIPLFSEKFMEKQFLLQKIKASDIVLIHWWNHPLLYDFLVRSSFPPSRIIFWSHVSGLHPPYVITEKALTFPDIFVFTTPLSREVAEVQRLSDTRKETLRVVWSTSGIDHVKDLVRRDHVGFNIGYIGTVDYAKMHPNFIDICFRINIPESSFIVCGGPDEKAVSMQVESRKINDSFHFTGLVQDIRKYLSVFDVFGYPLAPYHYGTCDQSLAESMAAGVVPVVFSNPMESFMVQDGVSGLVANNESEYVKSIVSLYSNPELRERLSKNARVHALRRFSLDVMLRNWEQIFEEVIQLPKTPKKWPLSNDTQDISAADVFLEALGSHCPCFKEHKEAKTNLAKMNAEKQILGLAEHPAWSSRTKGTVHHYKYFFSSDYFLTLWSKLME